MQNRIEKLRRYIEEILFSSVSDMRLRYFFINHMVCVSQFCALIALKRGENTELATMAGLLHDIHVFTNLDTYKHAKQGAVQAREILEKLQLTTAEETDQICSAIRNHSKKKGSFSSFDEVLIDADVLEHGLHNITLQLRDKDMERFNRLIKEFGLGGKPNINISGN